MAFRRHLGARRGDVALGAWSVVLGILMLAPLAAPGYVLSYDMVVVPDQALLPSSVGVSSALPRAVPLDAVVAIVDDVVPAALVQRLALFGVVVGAAWGAGRALPASSTPYRLVAASVYGWNAYVFERLVIGHWPVLIGYALLPWLLIIARRVRAGQPGAAAGGVLLAAVAAVTATGGILTSTFFAALVLAPGGRQRRRTKLGVVLALVALQAPWIVPGLVRPQAAVSAAAGVEAFAARADAPSGLIGSLMTLGGIWNAGAVPGSRALMASALLSGVIVALALAGARELRRRMNRVEAVVVPVFAAGGLVLAAAGAVPGGRDVIEWLVTQVPGAGLVRDGQKFLAWFALLLAMAAGHGTARIVKAVCRPGTRAVPRLIACGAVLLPLAALPDLAAGAAGRLTPVQYPQSWAQIRTALHESSAPGDVVVLPFQPYRSFPWADGRTVLDPAPRYFGVEPVVPDALPVGGSVVPGEDPRARRIDAALTAERPLAGLAAAGVGWIIVLRDTPGEVPGAVVAGARRVAHYDEVELFRVPGPIRPWTDVPPRGPIVAANIVCLATLAVASVDLVRNAVLRRRRSIGSLVS